MGLTSRKVPAYGWSLNNSTALAALAGVSNHKIAVQGAPLAAGEIVAACITVPAVEKRASSSLQLVWASMPSTCGRKPGRGTRQGAQ